MAECLLSPPPPGPAFWNDVRCAEARRLWSAGASSGEIAQAIGAPSAAAVVARMWREGTPRPGASVRFREPRLIAGEPLPAPPPATIAAAPRPWLTRRIGECAFPIDPPASGQPWRILSCCNPCGRATYCPTHRTLMRRVALRVPAGGG